MALRLLARELSDLCIGKPALRSLCQNDTVGEALQALKKNDVSFLSVWRCHHSLVNEEDERHNSINEEEVDEEECQCVGRICMVDIILFLAKPENLSDPASALQTPISELISKTNSLLVCHLDPHASLLEAIDAILEGAHHIVIPIWNQCGKSRPKVGEKKSSTHPTNHRNNQIYCWLAQEDIIRYLLNLVGLFSVLAINPINTLNVIESDDLISISYYDPASSAVDLISAALVQQKSVAIVDHEKKLIGEISPFTLNSCDESVAAAIATLSAGDLMAYVDCGSPPDDIVQLIKDILKQRNLGSALELFEDASTVSRSSSFSSFTSSDDELPSTRNGKHGGYSARLVRRSEGIVCYPWSSLVAVMIQALAHRASYVWVVEEDGSLTGVVTFAGMLRAFREHLKSI